MERCLTCGHRGRCEVGTDLCRTDGLLRRLAPSKCRRHIRRAMRRAASDNWSVHAEAICAVRGTRAISPPP